MEIECALPAQCCILLLNSAQVVAGRVGSSNGTNPGHCRCKQGSPTMSNARQARTRWWWSPRRTHMDLTTLLIIVVILLLLGGGGWYGRGRWY